MQQATSTKHFYFLKDRKRNTRLVSLYMEAINKLDTNSFVIKDIHFSGSMTYRKCCFRLHVKKRQISYVVPKLLFVAKQELTPLTMRNRHGVLGLNTTTSFSRSFLARLVTCQATYVIVVVFSSKFFKRHKFQSV